MPSEQKVPKPSVFSRQWSAKNLEQNHTKKGWSTNILEPQAEKRVSTYAKITSKIAIRTENPQTKHALSKIVCQTKKEQTPKR